MNTTHDGQTIAAALKASFYQGIAEGQSAVVEIGRAKTEAPVVWYQPAMDFPFLALVLATFFCLLIAHAATVWLCRRAGVPSKIPLFTLWGAFCVSAGVGLLRVFPAIGGALLVAMIVFLVLMLLDGPKGAVNGTEDRNPNPFVPE